MSIREKLSVVAAGTIKPYYPFTPVESLYYNKSNTQGPLENYNYDNTGEYSLNTFEPGSTATARIFNTDKLLENVWLELQFEPVKGVTDNAGTMFYAYDCVDSITYRIGGEERQTVSGANLPFKWIQELTKDPEKYKKFYEISGPMTYGCLIPTYTLADPAANSTLGVDGVMSTATVMGYHQSPGIYYQGEAKSADITNGTSKWDYGQVLLPLPHCTIQNRYINGVKSMPNYMTDKGLQIDVKFNSNPCRKVVAAKIRYKFLDTYKDDELKQVVYKYPYKHSYDDSYAIPFSTNTDNEYSVTVNSFKYGEVTQLLLRAESNMYVPFPGCSSKYFGVPLKDIKVEVNNQIVFKSDGHSYGVHMLESSDGILGEVRPIFVDPATPLTANYAGTTLAGDASLPTERLGKRGYYYVIPIAAVLDSDTHHDYTMGMSLLSKSLVVKFKLAANLDNTKLAWNGTKLNAAGDGRIAGPAASADSTIRLHTQTSYNAILQFDGRNVKFQT